MLPTISVSFAYCAEVLLLGLRAPPSSALVAALLTDGDRRREEPDDRCGQQDLAGSPSATGHRAQAAGGASGAVWDVGH